MVTYVHYNDQKAVYSYNVQYDDGDIEKHVSCDNVRKSQSPPKRNRMLALATPQPICQGPRTSQLRVGYTVETNCQHKYKRGRYHPGIVSYVDKNGSYNIQYLDGDVGEYVLPKFVRKVNMDEIDIS